jgi:hypothetical protein
VAIWRLWRIGIATLSILGIVQWILVRLTIGLTLDLGQISRSLLRGLGLILGLLFFLLFFLQQLSLQFHIPLSALKSSIG